MQMRKYLLLLVLVIVACMPVDSMAQKHRHNPQLLGGGAVDTVTVGIPPTHNPVATADSLKKAEAAVPDAADTMGIEAFSDTTSAGGQVPNIVGGNNWDDDDNLDETSRTWFDLRDLPSIGFGEGVFAVVVIIFVVLLLLAPFILLGFIVWVILKNRNQRYKLAEKAMEQGQQIPEPLLKDATRTNSDLWSRGIRNVFLGLGLAVFFLCWDANFLSGLGWLLFFYGVGQAVIAKTSGNGDASHLNEPPRGM